MPYKKTYRKYKKSKAKYRQQKLSVDTVTKIATRVAKRLDKLDDFYNERDSTDFGAWYPTGALDPNNIGLPLRPTPTILNVGWSPSGSIPTTQTTVTFPPGGTGTIDRLNVARGQRSSTEVMIDKITFKGVIIVPSAQQDFDPATPAITYTVLSKKQIVTMKLISVTVPMTHQPGLPDYTVIGYQNLINPGVIAPENNMFFDHDTEEAFKTQKVIKTKKIYIKGEYGVINKYNYNFTVKFKRPYKLEYSADEPNGALPRNKFLYLGVCVDTESTASFMRPTIIMNHRIYYREKA